jgi:N6-adenosine-specific RNA methylase IME4
MTAFKVIAIDPPWRFSDALPGNGRGAIKHYPCMTVPQLCEFALPPLDPSAVLFLWRVSSMQREAFEVMDAWGFRLHSEVVWRKLTKTGTKEHFGMGRIVRGAHETCLIGIRGKKTPKVLDRGVRSVFSAPVGRHSEKPGAFYSLVERLFPGPYVELFARRHREKWTCFGNELSDNADDGVERVA